MIAEPEKDAGMLVYSPLLEGARYPNQFFNFIGGKAWTQSNLKF
jgi:hypothetical protein